MNIFISYAFDDKKIAEKLKNVLKKNPLINMVYIAQDYLNFDIEISKKITNEINKSDCVVAIITKKSKESISVGQEIGFAYEKKPIIPLVEECTKSGIFCESKDMILFTRDNFNKSCNDVLKYILKCGSRKINEVTLEVLQKSKYPRSDQNYLIRDFVFDAIYYRFNISENNTSSTYLNTHDPNYTEILKKIKDFFQKDYVKNRQHLLEINYDQIIKLNKELIIFKNNMDDIKQKYSNIEFPQNEQNLIYDLHENIQYISDDQWNQNEYIQYGYNLKLCSKNPQIDEYQIEVIKKHQKYFYQDMQKIVSIMINIIQIYDQYAIQFPNDAFKNNVSL